MSCVSQICRGAKSWNSTPTALDIVAATDQYPGGDRRVPPTPFPSLDSLDVSAREMR